ncbi:COG4315 family predicted lipoprotein [Curtobacterium sp. 22159]|uniref:COG4315 family predicted lipoprotein n=1 Tax=Curtobacterium sp. 22159 TaxID=3453882 RepID=UPI003F853028
MRTIRSTRPALLVVGVAFAATVLAGCATQSTASSGASSSPSAASSTSSSATSSSSASAGSSASSGGLYGTDDHGGATSGGHGSDDGIATASTSLGTVVVDGKGMTAYFYDEDVKGSGRSTCTGGCAAAWPAIESDAPKPTVSGVTGTVGTITGVDGKLQVTVDGRPVYTYAGDSKAGDVTGQGVGGVWYAVDPDGSEHR